MKVSEFAREGLIEAVEKQIKSNDPPETKQTFDRLVSMGYSDRDAKGLITQCISIEIFEIMNDGDPHDKERYAKNLAKLPDSPF